MNAMLHGIDGSIILGDALGEAGASLAPADAILTNPPFGTKPGAGLPERPFPTLTSNKQLAFLQHIYLGLKPGGRAAVVMPAHVTFQDLSEGEQQLLTVLGLLKFTQDDESLFLLDEPDTHLNPQWKFDYLQTLEAVVGPHSKSQMVIATHDPLVVLSLNRDQVRLFKRDEQTGRITAEPPNQNPCDLSVATLLTSDLYGLRGTVAPEKLELLDKKRLLAAMEILS